MPLPMILGGVAIAAAVTGVGSGVKGGIKMKEANDTMKVAQTKQDRAVNLFKRKNEETAKLMDEVGTLELSILNSFGEFSNLIEKIQGRPDFKAFSKDGVELPKYEPEDLERVSTGAGVLLGGLGGAALGTAGGFAAAGATTSAVMALGTASTGTAIASLSGVAATNATLAALGGGAIAAGGGGMALGSAVLGGATLGVGLLVGGIIFNVTGSKLSNKADTAMEQAKNTEKDVNRIVGYFDSLYVSAAKFLKALKSVNEEYQKRMKTLDYIINFSEKTKWSDFSNKEKLMTENLVMLVSLLYKMCKTKLVLKSENENELNKVNKGEIQEMVDNANVVVADLKEAV